MQNKDHLEYLKKRTDFGQLKLIGRISLWFSFLAIVGMLIIYFSISSPGDSYHQNIRELSISQKNLPWVMLVTGLILIMFTGIITWMITLYSTFRIAGPLFRFSRNVEEWIKHEKCNTVPLRKEDSLQEESHLMEETINTLYEYLGANKTLLKQALQAADSGDIKLMNSELKLLKAMADKATTHETSR